ncbi:MAG TPA: hypothetical protein VM096_17890 [Vicinamibacterales bacterium]|nr:hypothetical protein [Vicinamibacterales bacterium]
MFRRCGLPLSLLVLFSLAAPGLAAAQLTEERTPGLRVIYFDGTEGYLLPHATRTALNSLAFQKKLFGFDPSDDVSVLLLDLSDSGNAGAATVPGDLVSVQIAPLGFSFETLAANERLNTIMNHELVHIATMDQAARSDRMFRRLFGGKVMPIKEQPESILYFYLTSPRVAAPRWFHEGIAVFVDTWMAGGIGRVQSGYDEMVFRAMVRDNSTFYNPLGLVSKGTDADFQLEVNSYLYGARFMTWLARRYSPEQLIEWTARHEGSRAYYAAQFKQVFGVSLEEAWAQWIADERTFQLANLAAIRKFPVTQYRDVTSRALGSVSRAFFDPDSKKIYAAFNYPGVVAHVGSIDIDTGAVQRLTPIKGPVIYTVTSLAWDPGARTLFYTADNGSYRDLMQLDSSTGKKRLLQKDARIGDIVFSKADKALWGIRHLNGLVTIVRIPEPYTSWEQMVTLPYGTIAYDLDVSPDGTKLVASFGEITGAQDVRVLSIDALKNKDATPLARFNFAQSVPNDFTFSADGRFLYGSSYLTGVSNIFRYELATGTVEAVSNTDTGFFRPVPLGGDNLLVFRYTGNGFVPARIVATPVADASPITFLGERLAADHPVVHSWNVGSPLAIPYESLDKRQTPYKLFGGMRMESLYPIVQGYKDTAAVGMRFNVSDRIGLNRASVAASYSPITDLPSSERVHLEANYERYDWRGHASFNKSDFYDLVGPTQTSRKGYEIGAGRSMTLIYDEPRRLTVELDGRLSGNLDRLPDFQNVVVDVDRLGIFDAELNFSDVRKSLGGVDSESGVLWTAAAQTSVVDRDLFAHVRGSFDRGLALPAGHMSVWFRQAAGFSPNDRRQPFANFFFGGFGNNYVDRGKEQRYRDTYSMPGAALNAIGGRNFVKSMIDLNLPPLRFQRFGTSGLYIPWMRPAIFVSGLATNLDDRPTRRVVYNAGAQVDFSISALSVLDMTLSIGGAFAFEDRHAPRREAMISLKVLR